MFKFNLNYIFSLETMRIYEEVELIALTLAINHN
jgi:hypothetical protein